MARKKVPQSARLSAGGGPVAIWAMPKCRGRQTKSVFPYGTFIVTRWSGKESSTAARQYYYPFHHLPLIFVQIKVCPETSEGLWFWKSWTGGGDPGHLHHFHCIPPLWSWSIDHPHQYWYTNLDIFFTTITRARLRIWWSCWWCTSRRTSRWTPSLAFRSSTFYGQLLQVDDGKHSWL